MSSPCPPGMAPEFRLLMETLYKEFAAPTPRSIEGCPCCLASRKPDVLLSKPLRDLTGGDLWRYVTGVFLTIGSQRDYRFLLPRILELAVAAPNDMPDTAIVLGTLARAEWRFWPARERSAIIALINHWIEAALHEDLFWLQAEGQSGALSGDVICGAAHAELDITPWLARLAEPPFEPVRKELALLNRDYLNEGRPPPFWEEVSESWQTMTAVLTR